MLRTLHQQTSDNFVALTFNLDLAFFEAAVYGPLHARGCRNFAVLCDPSQLQTSLRDVPALRHLGRGYACLPARASGSAFHPKLSLLTGRDGGFMTIGSANISPSGLTSNRETVTAFSYSESSPDEHARRVLRWTYGYLRRLAEANGDLVLDERLELLWETTGWLRRDPAGAEHWFAERGSWPLHNLDRPLLEQLADRWHALDGGDVREAVVVSPYFDRRADALQALLEVFGPERLTVVTEHGAAGMRPQAFRRALERSGVAWKVVSPQPSHRRLHGKALALRTEKGDWLLTGSANFTSPALLRRTVEGNAELAVLRHEAGSRLVDFFLGPLLGSAVPLDLDWEARLDEEQQSTPTVAHRILSAELSGRTLRIKVHPEIPSDAQLRVELRGGEEASFKPAHWTAEGNVVSLVLPDSAEIVLSGPASIELVVGDHGGEARSTRMAVHDLDAIRRSSQPVRRGTATRIPPSLVRLEGARHLDLLGLLEDLLAMNPQQLRSRRGVSADAVREARRERALDAPEGYDPEAMIVEERVRLPQTSSAAELYVDYEDRWLYEGFMKALSAAVYSPDAGLSNDAGVEGQSRPAAEDTGHLEQSEGIADRAQRHEPEVQKVVGRYSRLIRRFERGTRNSEYFAEVPPPYLTQLFYVLLTYLRLLRVEGLVDQDSFLSFSERLFAALTSIEDMGGQISVTPVDGATREGAEEGGLYWAQAWLHLYLIADLCLTDRPEHLPKLGQLMRSFERQVVRPAVVHELPRRVLEAVWSHTMYPGWRPRQPEEIVSDLEEYVVWYDEQTLTKELRRSPSATAYVDHGLLQGRSVPTLNIAEPWHDEELDRYWKAFAVFCGLRGRERSARLLVRDTNVVQEDGNKAQRLMLFYSARDQRLRVQVNLTVGGVYQGVVSELSVAEISRLGGVASVVGHEGAKTLMGKAAEVVRAARERGSQNSSSVE